MNAIRSLDIKAPSLEELELLVEDADVTDLARASTARLDGVVGNWSDYNSVEAQVETSTYHALDGFAAMVFGLVLRRPRTGRVDLATVTVTAATIDGTTRIISVDHLPARVMIEDGDDVESHGADRFVGTFAASFHETSFARTSPIAHAHLAGFGLGWEGLTAVTVTGEAGAVAASFQRLPGRGDETDRYVFDAEVEATFATDEADIEVTTVFDARVTACVDGDDLLICAIDFLPARDSGLPGSRSNPVSASIRGIEATDGQALCYALAKLGMDDMTPVSTKTLNASIDGGEDTGVLWQDVASATLTAIRGTMTPRDDHTDIDAVLRCTDEAGASTDHDVIARVRIDRDGIRLTRLMQRSAVMDS